MRIVVTGVTGQVGKALVAPLARLGTVVPSDRSYPQPGRSPPRLPAHSIGWRQT